MYPNSEKIIVLMSLSATIIFVLHCTGTQSRAPYFNVLNKHAICYR